MKKNLLFVISISIGFDVFAQIPITYYDFENNTNRTIFENFADQRVNTIASEAFSLVGGGILTSAAGNGILNAQAMALPPIAAGSCIQGQGWQATNSDPGIGATRYFEFSFSTVGFTGTTLYFQILTGTTNSNSPNIGVLVSTNGGTSYSSVLGGTNTGTNFWYTATLPLPAAADNNPNCKVRIYGYKSPFDAAATINLDNVSILASATMPGKVFTSLDELSIFTGTTSGGTGFVFTRNNFTCTGAGTYMTLGSPIAMAAANSFTVSNTATLDFGINPSTDYYIFGSGNFTLNAATSTIIRSINGISNTAGIGNLRVSGTRSVSGAANFTYTHVSGTAQNTGTALPVAITGNLTINNSGGVTLTQATALSSPSTLYITNGVFTNVNTLTLNNATTINRDAGSLSLAPTFNPQINIIYSGSTPVTTANEVPSAKNILADLTLNKTAAANTVTLGNNVKLNGTFYPNTGTLNCANNDFTIVSTATYTARVAPVAATASLVYSGTGRFDIERFLPAFKAWRLVATPIQRLATDATTPSISAAWREGNSTLSSTGFGTQITGPVGPFGAAGVLDASTQRGSLKSFDASNDKFIEIANANTTTLANKEGYFVFVRGDRGVGVGGTTAATTLRMKGKLLTGDQVFTVPVNKFQSFGNPYPSRIDFRTVTKSTINESFYVWNPNPVGTIYNAGKYEVYVKDISDGNYKLNGSGAIRNYIESGQAVFIQSVTGGAITVKETDKFGGSSLVSRGGSSGRTGVVLPTLEINMHTTDVNGSLVLADAAIINFDNSYSNAVDNLDVKKITNASDNLSILNNAQNLAVERRSSLALNDTIKLGISALRVATYRFEINPSVLENAGVDAFLKDKFLQTETAISLTDITNINFDVTNNAASYAADRFMIVCKAAPIYSSAFKNIVVKRNANKSVLINWQVASESNVTNQQIEKSDDGITFVPFGNKLPENNTILSSYNFVDEKASRDINYYRIKSIRANGSFVYSDLAKVNALENLQEITVSPNPVENKSIHFTLNNLPLGQYNLQIINEKGNKIYGKLLNHISENSLYKISIADVASGTYNLIIESGKEKYTKSIIIK